MKRKGQHTNESAMEYLRRVVGNCDFEPEGILDDLPSVEAVLDFFELWTTYGTDFWSGVLDAITEGENPKMARAFVRKHKLPDAWLKDIDDAVERRREVV